MMNIVNDKLWLSFDDVLIMPKLSDIESRRDINISTRLGNWGTLSLPILSANMDTITGPRMAKNVFAMGGLGVLHRFTTDQQRVDHLKSLINKCVGSSIGLHDDRELIENLIRYGADPIVIDVANGYMGAVQDRIAFVRTIAPSVTIIAGNVATATGASALFNAGADGVKVGIGPGSVCTTRTVTGCGVPQLTAIMLCADAKREDHQFIVADGGIRSSGDIVKALAAGADAVMIGRLLAGTREALSTTEYRGNASRKVSEENGKEWYVEEGISISVNPRESAAWVLRDLEKGIRSGFSYAGAKDLRSLQQTATFIRVTDAGYRESLTRD